MSNTQQNPPRCIAIVGPLQSGKTSLLEAILARTGVISRQGKVGDGNTVGDAQPEARSRGMSVEPNVATATFLDETLTFVDCPGSVEFLQTMRYIVPFCDAAIVVCEADQRKLPALEIIMRELEDADVPRFLFINKIESATHSVQDTLALFQKVSRTPLLLRQLPVHRDGVLIGSIDLALERAYLYQPQAPSQVADIPADELEREKEARFTMLERLADHDDALMEELLSEVEPARDRVVADLTRELRERKVVSALIGSSERGNGITRLLKALRHEAPLVGETRVRLGVSESGPALAAVLKTLHTSHGGKLSIARILRGRLSEGDEVTGSSGATARVAGVLSLQGSTSTRIGQADVGNVAGLARLEKIATGECFALGKVHPEEIVLFERPQAVFEVSLVVKDRKDDVRLTAALSKLAEEDPSLSFETCPETGELRLRGQGEIHLRVALERLNSRFQVGVETAPPKIGYRETIRSAATARGRHKKQTGGHGQFGDVVLHVEPLARGEGFVFKETITGGAVPRQYIPSVETGVREALRKGPLGFPVTDLSVTLTDGSYHSVDSSDASFQAAAKLAIANALPAANPVLLEPILSVEIAIPSDALSKATALVSPRRGQILGYDSRPGWEGWDVLRAWIPQAEVQDLIVELRSATAGVGTFSSRFDHMAELMGRAAEQVLDRA